VSDSDGDHRRGRIRIVRGSASGPTALAAYDAALADAGIAEYNLSTISSVIPATAAVEVVDTAPDLGPTGNRLTIVEAEATASDPGTAVAGLGWVRSVDGGPGIVYEATGDDPDAVERRLREGLAAGADLREWEPGEVGVRIEATAAGRGVHAAAVVAAVYGESEPIL